MRLGPGSHPRAEEGLGGVRSGDSNELVSRLTERTIRTKSDCLEADAQVLVADDLAPLFSGGCAACAPPWQSRYPATYRYSSRVDGRATAFCRPGGVLSPSPTGAPAGGTPIP